MLKTLTSVLTRVIIIYVDNLKMGSSVILGVWNASGVILDS